jgi:hypothetical protein
LTCSSTTACAGDLWFINKGIPNALPVKVDINKAYTLGNGCVPPPPIPPPTAPPSPGPGPSCFSKSNLVEAQGKGIITMASLEVGDVIRTTNNNDSSRVIAFMHNDPLQEVEYLQIYTDASAVPLEISKQHLVYLGNDHLGLVPAKDLNVGDVLSTGQIVTQVQSVKRQGLFAPLTESGNLWVSGVHASCYVSVLDEIVVPPVLQVLASHALLAPLRMACAFDFSICKNAGYSKEGFSTNLLRIIQAGVHFADFHAYLQMFLLVVVTPLLVGLASFEQILFTQPVVAFLAAGFFLVVIYGSKRKRGRFV